MARQKTTDPLVVAPGVAIRAPFENSVGTREGLRSRGIGTGMVDAARQLMRGDADGMFVYRNAERSAGYRFYVRNGHHDLLGIRYYRQNAPTAESSRSDPIATGRSGVSERAAELLPIFLSAYGQHGGYVRRHLEYWDRALGLSIHAQDPTEFHLLGLRRGESLAGYALAGVARRRDRPARAVSLLEIAARGADLALASRMVAMLEAFAAERGLAVEAWLSDEDPFVPVFLARGFTPEPRGAFIMGQVIDVPGFFSRYWRDRLHLDGVGLAVWTPAQDHVLVRPHPGFPTLTLEMKEETLHRWLLGRIDLTARLREGTVSAFGACEPPRRAVRAAIPFTPWAYHHLDYT